MKGTPGVQVVHAWELADVLYVARVSARTEFAVGGLPNHVATLPKPFEFVVHWDLWLVPRCTCKSMSAFQKSQTQNGNTQNKGRLAGTRTYLNMHGHLQLISLQLISCKELIAAVCWDGSVQDLWFLDTDSDTGSGKHEIYLSR